MSEMCSIPVTWQRSECAEIFKTENREEREERERKREDRERESV